MNIVSWNKGWIFGRVGNEKRMKKNIENSLISEELLKNREVLDVEPDILALLEAGVKDGLEDNILKIQGYKGFFGDREKYVGGIKYINGILLYIKDEYNPDICLESQKEFKENNIECFLPITLEVDCIKYNCLFVWATQKYYGQEFYGFNNFKEILDTEARDNNFKETRKFLDGKENNVIIIGDFNIVYPKNLETRKDKTREKQWKKLTKIMNEDYNLKWVENTIPTYEDSIINDHCFVSEDLHDSFKLEVKERKYGNVKSDHNLIVVSN